MKYTQILSYTHSPSDAYGASSLSEGAFDVRVHLTLNHNLFKH